MLKIFFSDLELLVRSCQGSRGATKLLSHHMHWHDKSDMFVTWRGVPPSCQTKVTGVARQ